ncbi:hypothetical protein HY311_01380 [Candidatus Nomurabacteria bacterium]|nr:hypothetical protein [Candidatus Nomurabacteria bacterium]
MKNKFEFICGNKYMISVNDTILLPVLLDNLPSKITVDSNELLLKSAFHISLVCIKEIIRKHNIIIPNFKDLVVNDFCEFTKNNDINLLNYLDEFKLIVEDDLRAVVVLCKVSNLDKFFELINNKYGLKIEYPPTHVTLYTPEGKPGIFLTDANDIKNLTKPIPNPIGHNL